MVFEPVLATNSRLPAELITMAAGFFPVGVRGVTSVRAPDLSILNNEMLASPALAM